MFRPSFIKKAVLSAATLCLTVGMAAVHAAYPEHPIKLLVPYPPGGATDVIGRVVGKALSDELGATVVVENRGGASGSIGAAEVARAKADGYTLLMGALTSHSIYQNLYHENVTYNLATDFDPIAIVGKVPLVFIVNPKVPANSIAELIDLAKSDPGKYSIASAGVGSPQHMAAELFALTAGVELMFVPYRGSGPAMADLVGGQVDGIIETVPAAQSFIKSNQVKALAVTSGQRAPTLPDVETAEEGGLKDFNVESMFGVLAPAGTPKDRITTLSMALQKALSSDSVQEALLNQGVVAGYVGLEDAAAAIENEVGKWKRVITEAGITPE